MSSPGLDALKDSKLVSETKPLQDQEALAFYIQQINAARDQRFVARPEFDGLTYQQDYSLNQQAAYSYLAPKRNDDEVRVNSGTAEKKVELILNELLAMNFQPEIKAFDEDDLEVEALGDDMADIVHRSNEIERDEDLYTDTYLELLTQRAVFVEEFYGPLQSSAVRTGKPGKFKDTSHCQKRMLSGLQIFLGDMTIPASRFNEQPYIVKYNRMLYEEAERLYGDMPNWKYVRPGMAKLGDTYGLWFKYRLGNLTSREVEVMEYMSTSPTGKGEYQIIINSVMMYDEAQPLPWAHGGYNMAMVVVKPISPFLAYGKPPIASAKALQGLQNETLRNLIRKMRQAIEPPLGVASGKVYGKDIWAAGAVTQGIPAGSFERLIDHNGVTPSEFQMYQLINSEIEKFIGQSGAAQVPGTGTPTATQIIEQQKQSLKMLGLAVLAAMRLKREMTYLRLWNLVENAMKPTGKNTKDGAFGNKYRNYTVNSTDIGDGATGTKVIKFVGKDMTEEELEQMFGMEESAEAEGQPFRFHAINVEKLKDIPLNWYVVITSHEREGGALDKIMFQDQMSQAANLSQVTGRKLSADKIIDSFEQTWKARGWFERDAVAQDGAAPAGPEGMLKNLQAMAAESAQPTGQIPPMAPSAQGSQLVPKTSGIMPGATQLANG